MLTEKLEGISIPTDAQITKLKYKKILKCNGI
jgi:hypothetical protein